MSVNLRVKIEIGSLVKLHSNFFEYQGFLLIFAVLLSNPILKGK